MLNATSMFVASPFYSVILGFQGTTNSPPLLPWVPKPTLCQTLWWLVLSLFFIVFFLWCYFPKCFLLTFHSGVSLKGWPPISLPLMLLNLTFSDSAFWLSFFLSSFPGEPNPSLLGWMFSRLLLFIVFLSRLLKVPTPCSWIVTLQAFWFFSASLGNWEEHICPSFLVFLGGLFELCQSHPSYAARPKDPEPLAVSSILAQLFPSNFLWFSDLDKLGIFSFLPFVSWALRPVLLWVLGFKSFFNGLGPSFSLVLSSTLLYGVHPLFYFRPWCYNFFRPQHIVNDL